ncbi:paralemmin-3 isoform X1 [Simochromis diagramma]|uniref:paralemmin-3 isoform X1 n=2 Tax=Simochromis diagramma TaxID=43689 RepID=UPI001A7EF4F4|nr:paralemmin-3 isoform X1 [Simochromis diagramma]XP_039880545.1 paralemmin-3 isoform X1 [Simochromis diagramma]
MDEAEKYKQRIEAIAEKRRLQEEQDRSRREKEDEKLRLRQFKRKSLREQWLMEGAPLSPTSLDAESLHSPPWSAQAQHMEEHIEKSQSENKQLADEQEKLEKRTEDGETVKMLHAGDEVVSDVAQNGENNSTGSETSEGDTEVYQEAPLDENGVIVTNGVENTEVSASDENNQSLTNGPTSDVSVEMGKNLDVSEEDPVQVPNTNVKEEEEEEGTLVMRAECIFITDDGDDVSGEVVPQADQQESVQSDQILLPNPEAEASKEGGEAAEEDVQTETFTEPESEPLGDIDDSIKANPGEDEDRDVKTEGQDNELKDPACVQSQSLISPPGSTVVALLPVYTEAQPSNLSPNLQVQAEESAAVPEETEAASKAQEATCLTDQFQEVPLADAQENQRTEAGSGEQEPLLLNAKAPSTMVEPAGADSPANAEAQSPNAGSQGDAAESNKPKKCDCCSVM